jgi:hypothetical protein
MDVQVNYDDTRHYRSRAVQFWYGILNKELRCQVWDAMLIQLAQPTLANVFQLLEHVKMNMVEKK